MKFSRIRNRILRVMVLIIFVPILLWVFLDKDEFIDYIKEVWKQS